MNTYLFLVNRNSSGNSFLPIELKTGLYNEKWLQELLRKQPEILPVAEIETIFSPLVSIGREVTTNVGAIDNLFISQRGYLVLVETKLWRNPQAKREVIAQAIDYGSSLSKWNYERLNEVTKQYTKKYEQQESDLFEWVEQQSGPVDGGRDFFEETVSKNLRLGRFLTLIVGDKIRQPMRDILDYSANKYPHLATDIVLIELHCYHWNAQDNWPLLVVPKVVSKTEIVERSIVQITMKQDGAYHIEAQQQKSEHSGKGRKRVTLTEEAFWEQLKDRKPDDYRKAYTLIQRYQEKDGIMIEPTESAVVARLDIQDTGQQVSIFFVNKHAELCVWPKTIKEQLSKKVGISPAIVDAYEAMMRNILHMDKKRVEFACPIANADTDNFIEAVDTFCDELQRAELDK